MYSGSIILQLLYYAVLGFLYLRVAVALFNLLSRSWLRYHLRPQEQGSKISVLIPARNEESNIAQVLDSVLSQTYSDTEVYVLDDNSTDNTYAIAAGYAAQHPQVQVLKGAELPSGWLGKNWACHQLSQAATGDHLLFIDADLYMEPKAIEAALAELEAQNLSLLSLFPTQRMHSLGEKLVVPLMNYILLSLLPLRLIRSSRNPAFAAANGQFMLFQARHYHPYQWHSRMRMAITEDIEILRGMKQEGLRTETLLGHSLVYCRMYKSFTAAIAGFSKNFYSFFGNSLFYSALYYMLTGIAYIFLLKYLTLSRFLSLLAGILVMRGTIAYTSGQQPVVQAMLHPAQFFVSLYLIVIAIHKRKTGRIAWKGRRL